MKKNVSILLGIIFSAFFLYLAFRNVDFSRLLAVFSEASPLKILLLAGIFVFELVIRGMRWKLILSPSVQVRLSDTFRLEAIGLALNNILPLRLGEVGRATIGSGIFGVPMLTSISSILIERSLDALSLLFFFTISVRLSGVTLGEKYWGASYLMLGIIAGGMLFLLFLEELLAKSETFSAALARFPRMDKLVRQTAAGAEALRDWKRALLIITLGFAVWFLDAAAYHLAASAVNLQPGITYWKSMTLLCAGAFAVVMPAMPGYFGAYEYALMTVLKEWGVSPEEGLAYAGFIHLTGYTVVTTLGIIFLYGAGHSLGGIWKTIKK